MDEGLVVDVEPTNIEMKVGGGAGGVAGAGGGGGALARRLWAAALRGDAAAVSDLMALGAPFTTDWVGAGPLHCAAHGGSAAVARALLRAGAHTHARTKVERTALHIAAYHGHVETAEVLLEHMADPNTRDLLGMSALHWACARGHARLARTLLQHGADPSLEDRLHSTPADLTNDPDILQLLHNHNGTPESDVGREPAGQPPPSPEVSNTLESGEVLLKKLKQVHRNNNNKKFKNNATSPLSEVCAGALRRLRALGSAPTDDEHALLAAMRTGRTLLLSDAGKLLLKESSLDPKLLVNNQRISTVNQLTTVNNVSNVNNVTPVVNVTTASQLPSSPQPAPPPVSAAANSVPAASRVTGVSRVTGTRGARGRLLRVVSVRDKQRDSLDNFTLKKIITPEDNQVRYVAVPRKCVLIQKLPLHTPSAVDSLEAPVAEGDAGGVAGDRLVHTQEDTNDESEVMRLRQQVTSLRKRLAKYESITDEDE